MIDTRFYIKKCTPTLAEVAALCGAELQDASRAAETVTDINTMDKAGAGEICFFYDRKKKAAAQNIKAAACRSENGFSGLKRGHVCRKKTGAGHCSDGTHSSDGQTRRRLFRG